MDAIASGAACPIAHIPLFKLGIVAARFREPLEPFAPVAPYTYLYSKGGIPQANDSVDHSIFRSYVELQNKGREGETHLQHIVEHYDTLEDYMIFSQAMPFDLLSPAVNTTEQMVEIALNVPVGTVNPFNPSLFHDTADWAKINWTDPKESLWMTAAQLKTLDLAPYTPAHFWQLVLGIDYHPNAIRCMHGGTFAVRRETIRSQPREVYERALAEFTKANSTNPEVGFMMERFWAPLFSYRYWLNKIVRP